jgi:glycosyltransferase involved in cell wall biosynthesis
VSEVLAITNNLQQASFRLRLQVLLKPLEQRGVKIHVEVRPRSFLARRQLLKSADRFDAVLIQRKLLNPSDFLVLRPRAKKIFYDVDDAVMLHSRRASWLEKWMTGRRFAATAKNADQVVAGNEYLAEKFRAEGANVTVLPTVVDLSHYRLKSHEVIREPALVWIGSRSTLPYLEKVLPILREARKRVPSLQLITIADASVADADSMTRHIPWSESTESDSLIQGDIGIAPMPDDPWTRGKCGFKIVQYMAAGLPVIASPVGANAELVDPGLSGFLPKTESQWLDAISTLAGDTSLRARMGAAGRKRTEESYGLDRAVNAWANLLGGS